MKIIKENLNELFPDDATLTDHYNKHVNDEGKSINKFGKEEPEFTTKRFPTKDDYNKAADAFARKPVKDSEEGRIVGFIDKRGKHHKFDKKTREFTVYYLDKNGNPTNISYYMYPNYGRYLRDKAKNYDREIDDEQEQQE